MRGASKSPMARQMPSRLAINLTARYLFLFSAIADSISWDERCTWHHSWFFIGEVSVEDKGLFSGLIKTATPLSLHHCFQARFIICNVRTQPRLGITNNINVGGLNLDFVSAYFVIGEQTWTKTPNTRRTGSSLDERGIWHSSSQEKPALKSRANVLT